MMRLLITQDTKGLLLPSNNLIHYVKNIQFLLTFNLCKVISSHLTCIKCSIMEKAKQMVTLRNSTANQRATFVLST